MTTKEKNNERGHDQTREVRTHSHLWLKNRGVTMIGGIPVFCKR